jgi:hypothetical protein
MNTLTPQLRDEDWEAYDGEQTEQLPQRPRRQFFNRRSAALGALVTCAIGFYAGIRVEKGQLASSTTTLPGAAGTGGAAARGGTSGSARGGLASLFAGGGRTGGFAGAAGGGQGSASFGTVASVKGKTIYVTEASGNTVKVNLSAATKVSKTQSVSRSAIRPGDTVVVQGVSSGRSVTAASVTDSGARSAGGFGGFGGGANSTGKSPGSGPGGTNSAVGSLFSSGG